MAQQIAPNVLSWASVLDDLTRDQAALNARLPILAGHLALMPDAHLGKGATIGSVIPTDSAVIPSAVGVDIGCGMAARRLDLTLDGLPDGLQPWIAEMEATVPAGLGRWHREPSDDALSWFAENTPPPTLDDERKAAAQLVTLGSGNHFIELATDEEAGSGSCCIPARAAAATSSRRSTRRPRASSTTDSAPASRIPSSRGCRRARRSSMRTSATSAGRRRSRARTAA